MTAKEGRKRFPQFVIDDDEVCVLDDWAGYIESERAVAMMAGIAREDGVVVREESLVTGIDETADGVRVHVEGVGSSEFDRVVVAGGVWSGRLVPEVGKNLLVTLREMIMIEVEEPEKFARGRFPVWSDDPDVNGWYGFPLLREGYVKVAIEGNRRDRGPGHRPCGVAGVSGRGDGVPAVAHTGGRTRPCGGRAGLPVLRHA